MRHTGSRFYLVACEGCRRDSSGGRCRNMYMLPGGGSSSSIVVVVVAVLRQAPSHPPLVHMDPRARTASAREQPPLARHRHLHPAKHGREFPVPCPRPGPARFAGLPPSSYLSNSPRQVPGSRWKVHASLGLTSRFISPTLGKAAHSQHVAALTRLPY